jgi:UDP-glucose 4-epimerase
MADILITGGAGYIGSICCAKLIERGHSIVVIDDLSTGFKRSIPPMVPLYEINIRDQRALRKILSDHRVDVVFHFAAKALIPESMSNPGMFFDENVAGGILLLEELRRAKIRRFVFSSSAAVYGNPDTVPIVENHRKQPLNSYGETKLMLEEVLSWYARAYGWGVAALRYFNACGGWGSLGERHDPETHVIPLLLQAASDELATFKIYGIDYPTRDGTCLRDYVHVLDIAEAHIRTMRLLNSPGMHAFNIGTGRSYSVREVITTVEQVVGKNVRVRNVERRPGDPAVLCADAEKLARLLEWRPVHSDLTNIVQTAWAFHQSLRAQLSV